MSKSLGLLILFSIFLSSSMSTIESLNIFEINQNIVDENIEAENTTEDFNDDPDYNFFHLVTLPSSLFFFRKINTLFFEIHSPTPSDYFPDIEFPPEF
jgi:hypothetical protein